MRPVSLLALALFACACGRERPPRYAYASTCGYAPHPPCERPALPAPAPRQPVPVPAPAATPPPNPLGWIAAWSNAPDALGLPGLVPWMPSVPGGAAPAGAWPAEWTALENEVLLETNLRRAQGAQCGERSMPPAPPLSLDTSLRAAARRHSQDMAEHSFVAHIGSDGSRPEQRIRDSGYKTKKVIGENAAGGYPTAKIVVDEWMTSRGHCINIMHKGFIHLGVGFAYRASSSEQEYFTQNFGGG